ncbi:MAG TPA: hypothetical protein DEG17_09995 [Cyanobacteria bacterium UBA11149]|nr:hypothetical protein [Cyanobacteria bacterium UBA11367]HBE56038.1 hypothetical protein [Cyanobacteria bacterium UBA11366]HBK63561.1 hypothetical protein [Cyanobacteria bacterium UBA11166]HBR73147.1 hypothetical protein [Cyanobacteria bacterium UBA11159]HBS70237.1 hypothetical protein [Cyanobacteria bacterium UBA11153]HBW89179.1 hypothetical protein [Cyanobacteria bacterium UBA11149]HCA94915.1 hypothetical protein [Cyanobacteria bacterium UBA9226]
METPGLLSFLEELESHCQTIAIATFLNSHGEHLAIDIKRRQKKVIYGTDWDIKEFFMNELIKGSNPHGTLVLRSFTSEIDEFTKLPIKELRGYIIKSNGQDLEFEKIPAHSMFACQNTDHKTGDPLPLEQAVRYC